MYPAILVFDNSYEHQYALALLMAAILVRSSQYHHRRADHNNNNSRVGNDHKPRLIIDDSSWFRTNLAPLQTC